MNSLYCGDNVPVNRIKRAYRTTYNYLFNIYSWGMYTDGNILFVYTLHYSFQGFGLIFVLMMKIINVFVFFTFYRNVIM